VNLKDVLVYDSESDGFVYEATKIHIISIIGAEKDDHMMKSYYGYNIEEALERLSRARVIVAHNQIKHDIPLFQKLYPDWKPPLVVDTLVLSALLNPERLGGHGIEAWGRRLGGEQKVQHEDWSKFSVEMLRRCESDVRLNKKVLQRLLSESYEDIDGVDIYNFDFSEVDDEPVTTSIAHGESCS